MQLHSINRLSPLPLVKVEIFQKLLNIMQTYYTRRSRKMSYLFWYQICWNWIGITEVYYNYMRTETTIFWKYCKTTTAGTACCSTCPSHQLQLYRCMSINATKNLHPFLSWSQLWRIVQTIHFVQNKTVFSWHGLKLTCTCIFFKTYLFSKSELLSFCIHSSIWYQHIRTCVCSSW